MNPEPEVPELLRATAGWGRRMEALGRALSHHLNGRANALSGLVEVVERGAADEAITGHLRAEVDRVTRVAGLLRLVVGPVGEQDVVTLSRLTTDAMALGSLEDKAPRLEPGRVEVVSDSAVRTDPALLARLLLLVRARLVARRPGAEVEVTVGTDEGLARVELRRATGRGGEEDGEVRTAADDEAEVPWEPLAAAAASVPAVEALVRNGTGEKERYVLTLRPLG